MGPKPSIEGTSTIRLRLLAAAPNVLGHNNSFKPKPIRNAQSKTATLRWPFR